MGKMFWSLLASKIAVNGTLFSVGSEGTVVRLEMTSTCMQNIRLQNSSRIVNTLPIISVPTLKNYSIAQNLALLLIPNVLT